MLNIGESLKRHREEANLNQSQLARQTQIKQQNISRWENNTHFPNILDCIRLATFYGISIDYLVGFENEDGTHNYIPNTNIHINGNNHGNITVGNNNKI